MLGGVGGGVLASVFSANETSRCVVMHRILLGTHHHEFFSVPSSEACEYIVNMLCVVAKSMPVRHGVYTSFTPLR